MKRGPNWEKSVQWPSSLRLQGKQILFPERAPSLEARLTGAWGTGLSDSAHRAQEALGVPVSLTRLTAVFARPSLAGGSAGQTAGSAPARPDHLGYNAFCSLVSPFTTDFKNG